MKTSKFLWVMLLFLAGSFSTELLAQKHLQDIVKKCKEQKEVDKSFVQRKNKDTKELERTTYSYSFPANSPLVQEIKRAFEQDRADAYQVAEDEKDGKINWYYRFATDKGSVAYSLDVRQDIMTNKEATSFTITERYGKED